MFLGLETPRMQSFRSLVSIGIMGGKIGFVAALQPDILRNASAAFQPLSCDVGFV